MDFLQSLTVAILGTFFGATAAFMLERALRRTEAKSKEAFALNALIVDLHLRRALSMVEPVIVSSEIAETSGKYAIQSIFEIRKFINMTRTQIRPKSDNFELLVSMHSACNLYLEKTELTPLAYQFELVAISEKFDMLIRQMCQTRNVDYRAPGSKAFP